MSHSDEPPGRMMTGSIPKASPPRLETPQRITEHDWPAGTVPLLSVVCWTYNHEKFIAQCIEGLLIQETDFPVEILIHDDASTDHTADIIRRYHARYPKMIRPVLQKDNQLQQGKNFIPELFENAFGTYIALCDGDDWWRASDKLQSQVDLLEANSAFSLCGHTVAVHDHTGSGFLYEHPAQAARSAVQFMDSYVKHLCFTSTSSVVLRTSMVGSEAFALKGLKMGDLPLFLFSSLRGPVGFIDRAMSCYRVHGNGAWSGLDPKTQYTAMVTMWDTMTPLLPKDIKRLAAQSVKDTALLRLSQSGSLTFSGKLRLVWDWLRFSIRSRRLSRRDIGFVLHRLYSW